MELTTVWFILIAVLWIGYFCLEGFDFGVGMLLPVLATDDTERRVMINTIGPVWDGNEVWLLVAGGATFAAFPEWYATLFSGFYLPLLLILLALIVRGLAFEYRAKRDDPAWRRNWDLAIIIGSFVPAVLWGVAFANILRGVPIDADLEYTGGFFNLLNPYALLGGAMTLLLFLTHGAMFLSLKTDGPIRERARALAVRTGLGAAVVTVAFLLWTQVDTGSAASAVSFALAAAALLGGLAAIAAGREGWAFLGTFVAIALGVAGLFLALFPDVMPTSLADGVSLTTTNAAATHYTLRIMTVVAVIFTPVVLVYQAWSYWVFRKRIAVHHIPTTTLAPGPAPPRRDEAVRPLAASAAGPRAAPAAGRRGGRPGLVRPGPRTGLGRGRPPPGGVARPGAEHARAGAGRGAGGTRSRRCAERPRGGPRRGGRRVVVATSARDRRCRAGPARPRPARCRCWRPAGSRLPSPTSPATSRLWCSPACCRR